MSKFSRRTLLMCGLFGTQALLAACGGGGSSDAQAATGGKLGEPGVPVPSPAPAPPPAPAPAPPPEWSVRQSLSFVAGALATIDLNDTLPTGVARGGVFSVDGSGAKLPVGSALTSNGLLTVLASAAVGVTSGVVFAYAAP